MKVAFTIFLSLNVSLGLLAQDSSEVQKETPKEKKQELNPLEQAMVGIMKKMILPTVQKLGQTPEEKEAILKMIERDAATGLEMFGVEWTGEDAKAYEQGTLKVEGFDVVQKRYKEMSEAKVNEQLLSFLKLADNEKLSVLEKKIFKSALPFLEKEVWGEWDKALSEKEVKDKVAEKTWILEKSSQMMSGLTRLGISKDGAMLGMFEYGSVGGQLTFTEEGAKITKVQLDSRLSEKLDHEDADSTKDRLDRLAKEQEVEQFFKSKGFEIGFDKNGHLMLRNAKGEYFTFRPYKDEEGDGPPLFKHEKTSQKHLKDNVEDVRGVLKAGE